MGKQQWAAVVLLAVAIVLHAVLPRYEVVVRDTGVFRIDRWTGHLDATRQVSAAPWATVWPLTHTARLDDILSVEKPAP